jgi:Uma2 family endonuclease
MSAQPQHLLTVDEFLSSADQREGRWELENGALVSMAPERLGHGRVKGDVFVALRDAVRRAGAPCEAVTDSVAVRITPRTAYQPDALVYCGPRLPLDALEVQSPVIIVEVLSPGTAWRDHGAKVIGYLSLPSLAHYLILSPDHRSILHHRRGDDGAWRMDVVNEGVLRLDPPGLDLPINEVFVGQTEV